MKAVLRTFSDTIAFVSCIEQLTSMINYLAGMMNKNEVNFPHFYFFLTLEYFWSFVFEHL